MVGALVKEFCNSFGCLTRQVYILGLIEEDDLITIQQMTQKMKVPEKTIKRELAALQEMGVLVREDGRKGGRWIIIQLTK